MIAEYDWAFRHGDATFTGTTEELLQEITSDDGSVETMRSDQYLVATGSAPWAPPIEALSEVGYLTSANAMELDEVPESLLVRGATWPSNTHNCSPGSAAK